MRCRGAFWPARSAGMNVHAARPMGPRPMGRSPARARRRVPPLLRRRPHRRHRHRCPHLPRAVTGTMLPSQRSPPHTPLPRSHAPLPTLPCSPPRAPTLPCSPSRAPTLPCSLPHAPLHPSPRSPPLLPMLPSHASLPMLPSPCYPLWTVEFCCACPLPQRHQFRVLLIYHPISFKL